MDDAYEKNNNLFVYMLTAGHPPFPLIQSMYLSLKRPMVINGMRAAKKRLAVPFLYLMDGLFGIRVSRNS